MRGTFICKNCAAPITSVLEVMSLKDPAVKKPVHLDQQPICAPGMAYKSYEPIELSYDPDKPADLEFAPQFWLNVEDVAATVKLTRKTHRLNGCCGLDGCDGPNMVCKQCRAEAGTLRTDCWTPEIFIPDKTNIEFKREDK